MVLPWRTRTPNKALFHQRHHLLDVVQKSAVKTTNAFPCSLNFFIFCQENDKNFKGAKINILLKWRPTTSNILISYWNEDIAKPAVSVRRNAGRDFSCALWWYQDLERLEGHSALLIISNWVITGDFKAQTIYSLFKELSNEFRMHAFLENWRLCLSLRNPWHFKKCFIIFLLRMDSFKTQGADV